MLFRVGSRGIDAEVGLPRRHQLNIALVVDRSGSMEGQSLEFVKRACGVLLDLIDPRDFVSVISFAETADMVLPARRIRSKSEAKDAINRISAGNTTNLHQGLMVGYQQIAAVRSAKTLDRIILVTDGEPTAGTKDFNAIVGNVVEQKMRGVSVTTIGLGSEYGEELLAEIALRSGGNFYHVPETDRLADIFRREFQCMTRVVADNIRLRVHVNRGVYVRQVYGHQPSILSREVEVVLSDLEGESDMRSLWEFEIVTRGAGWYRIAEADLRYDDLNTGRPERLTTDLVFEFCAEEQDPVDDPEPEGFTAQVEAAEAVRTIGKTLHAVRRQNLDVNSVIHELEGVRDILTSHSRERSVEMVADTLADIQSGGHVAKALMALMFNLDQGKAN